MAEASISELFSLRGRVALITGATGYLGSAMARALAEAGARVIVSSRDADRARIAAQALPPVESGPHLGVRIDHTQEDSLQQGFAAALNQTGAVDVLVNNAHDVSAADWRSVNAEQFRGQLNNLVGYFLLSRLFRDQIVARQSTGSLVLVGSMYGLVGSYPEVYEGVSTASPVAYQALKGGISQMTRHLAVYWARDGVRVNCLCPGPFPAPAAPRELVARLAEKSPMKRMGAPVELKGALVFLASDASSYMTGQNLVVDGGWTAW